MARAYSTKTFIPFPTTIDRKSFGHYLSGLTDGEGCFYLGYRRSVKYGFSPNPFASFLLSLRADDERVLELIRSFFQCGYVYTNRRRGSGNKNPIKLFQVNTVHDLICSIVPHFDQFPLYAKKSRDFTVWRKAVYFLYDIKTQPFVSLGRKGPQIRWTQAALAHFAEFIVTLRSNRKYNGALLSAPRSYELPKSISLFDDD